MTTVTTSFIVGLIAGWLIKTVLDKKLKEENKNV